MMRHLNLQEYTCRIMRMRLPGKEFQDLLRATLLLVGAFCQNNETNQEVMAVYFETIFLRLLQDELYVSEACEAISGIVADNMALSISLSDKLVNTVGELV
eukprot:COSAG05_NODE_8279_length_719_cov_0.700000_1_plen_100_part_10